MSGFPVIGNCSQALLFVASVSNQSAFFLEAVKRALSRMLVLLKITASADLVDIGYVYLQPPGAECCREQNLLQHVYLSLEVVQMFPAIAFVPGARFFIEGNCEEGYIVKV